MLDSSGLNSWAIALAWLISVVVGSFWYSPAGFGKLWSKLSGVDMMNMPKELASKAIASVAVASFIQVISLAIIINSINVTNAVDGFTVGLFVWAGFIAATTVGNNLYSRLSWKFWWLNASFFLLVFSINAVILSIF